MVTSLGVSMKLLYVKPGYAKVGDRSKIDPHYVSKDVAP